MAEKSIVEILMERDEIDRQEAIDMVKDCRSALEGYACGHTEVQVFSDEDDIIQELLGLEPDYLLEILQFEEKNA